jgi:hypothetical protein
MIMSAKVTIGWDVSLSIPSMYVCKCGEGVCSCDDSKSEEGVVSLCENISEEFVGGVVLSESREGHAILGMFSYLLSIRWSNDSLS